MSVPTPTEVEAANRYKTYRIGFTHGAGGKPVDDKCMMHPTLGNDYAEGYGHGRLCRTNILAEARERFGYEPNILRGQQKGLK